MLDKATIITVVVLICATVLAVAGRIDGGDWVALAAGAALPSPLVALTRKADAA